MTVEPQRKRRKWDIADPAGVAATPASILTPPLYQPTPSANPVIPTIAQKKPKLDADAIKRAQQAAAAVVNKLNMEAVAKGAVPINRLGVVDAKSDIAREVFINDAPTVIRHHLTKKTTQDEIQRKTHTVIVTRGRYYPAGSQIDPNEKPLHLRISPAVDAGYTQDQKQQAVNRAAAEIQRILQGERQSSDPAAAAVPPAQPSTTIPVGFEAPPDFGLSERITGPGGSYLSHIASQTKSTVLLKGRGSGAYEGPEPLHVAITAPHPEALRDAQRLATDLLQTVRNEFYRTYPHLAPPAPYVPGAPYPGPPGGPPPYNPQQAPPPTAYPPPAAPTSFAAASFQRPAAPGQPPAMSTSMPPTSATFPAPTPGFQASMPMPSGAQLANPAPAPMPMTSMATPTMNPALLQQGFSPYPPPAGGATTYPPPGAPPTGFNPAVNPYSHLAASAPPTAAPYLPQTSQYAFPATSGPPTAQLSLQPASSATGLAPVMGMQQNTQQAPALNQFSMAGPTAVNTVPASFSQASALAAAPQTFGAFSQPGLAQAMYPPSLASAPAAATAPTWPTATPGVPLFSGIIGAHQANISQASANPYPTMPYTSVAPAPNNGLQNAAGPLQPTVNGMLNAGAATSQQPSSPPKRRFREFKENPPQSQAPSAAAAGAQGGSVYVQQFSALGTMPASMQLPQAQLQPQAAPQMQSAARTGSVKVDADIAGGLVDYDGED